MKSDYFISRSSGYPKNRKLEHLTLSRMLENIHPPRLALRIVSYSTPKGAKRKSVLFVKTNDECDESDETRSFHSHYLEVFEQWAEPP